MASLSQPMAYSSGGAPARQLTPGLIGVLIWHGIVALLCFVGAIQLFQVESFFNLGTFAPRLIGVLAAGVGLALLYAAFQIARFRNGGRLIGIFIHFFGFGLMVLLTLHLLGAFIGIDALAEGVFRNAILLLGFPIGYAIVALGRRLDAEAVQKIGLGLMMLTLIALLGATIVTNSQAVAADGSRVGSPNFDLTLGAFARALLRPDTLAALGLLVAFLAAGIVLIRAGERFGETLNQREAWQGWLFLLPNFVNFMLFFALPLILSFYLSFNNYSGLSEARWVGLDNYGQILGIDLVTIPADGSVTPTFRQFYQETGRVTFGGTTLVIAARDPLFWQSLWTTIRYCVLLLLLSILPALGLALLLNSKIPGMTFFRAVYFLPSIAAVVGVALIWQWLYDPVIGMINEGLSRLAALFGGGPVRILWLTDEQIMLYSVVIMAAWQVIGFNTVILLAGLQGVPRDLVEAATVDGAGPWTRFRRIILPLLAPTTFFVTVTTLISGLQAFSEMFALFGNSTSNARLTVVFYLYQQGFVNFNMGYASATAWVLFVVIFAVTLIQFRLSSRSKAYQD